MIKKQTPDENNIILTGFMGTGKTTVGKLLASKLGFHFADTDDLIEDGVGQTIPEIFAKEGEAQFRKYEQETARWLGKRFKTVVATGGGLMLDPQNVTALSAYGFVFCLVASPDEILRRVTADQQASERPLLDSPDPRQRIIDLLEARKDAYGRFAQVHTDGKSAEQIADEILALRKGYLGL